MSSYKLNINFTEEALKVIYAAHQKLALTKAVAGKIGCMGINTALCT